MSAERPRSPSGADISSSSAPDKPPREKPGIVLVLCILAAAILIVPGVLPRIERLAGIRASITLEAYSRMEIGGDYSDALRAFGQDTELSRSAIGGSIITTYRWANSDGSSIIATYRDGKLMSKSQHGLR